jgi:hypothetical protein
MFWNTAPRQYFQAYMFQGQSCDHTVEHPGIPAPSFLPLQNLKTQVLAMLKLVVVLYRA